MILVVDNEYATQKFISFLKQRMLSHLSAIIDTKKLIPYDEYFNTDEFRELYGDGNVSAVKVVVFGMKHLSHKRYESNTHIFINPNVNYPGTQINLFTLCKLINFGNMSIDAYPIFTDTFNHFSKNLSKYIDKCIIGIG